MPRTKLNRKRSLTRTQRAGGEIMDNTLDAAASFGRIMAWMRSIFGTIIGLLLIALGIFMLTRKNKYPMRAVGTVQSAKCDDSDAKNVTCTITFQFTPNNGKSITSAPMLVNQSYVKGQNVTVHYDPANPNNFLLNPAPIKWIGGILLAFGLLILVFVWVWMWVVNRNKTAAVMNGAVEGVGMVDTMVDRAMD